MEKPKDINEHLATLPAHARAAVEELRDTIQAAAPDAVPAISYSMPAFKLNGHGVVCFAGFKDHYSLFPGLAPFELIPELEKHRSGRGTIRFEYDQELPVGLVKKVVKLRVADIEARKPRH